MLLPCSGSPRHFFLWEFGVACDSPHGAIVSDGGELLSSSSLSRSIGSSPTFAFSRRAWAKRADRSSLAAVDGFCCRGWLDDPIGVVKLSATGSIRAAGFLNRLGSRGRARTSAPMDLSSSVIVSLALFCRSALSSYASSVALIFCSNSGRSELALGVSFDFSPGRSARAVPAGGGSSRAAWSSLVPPSAWISPSSRSLGAASFGSAIRRSSVIVFWISSRWFFGVRSFQPPPSSAKLGWWKPAQLK
ncbi:hypothetical protein AALP_AAs70787U000100 [Arabis alpina]|uniref:Uncharacterized protein n=1 Tax=Arabis alpina TaxID=50452 RepID=A0A087FYN9_ARAAL|nr:hypothetical protein AALP_AAs70787U000100 [Arabis alpina]